MHKPVFPLQDQLRGFSRALFSTWLYHRRFNVLFDAGEGIATALLNRVFGIRKIFLSHGHADHIAGLINLVNIRNLGAGDQTASLEIYYPKNNTLIEILRQYLANTQHELSFNLVWRPVEADERIDFEDGRGKTFIRTFKTQHSHKQLSLGFNIVEMRRRLKAEFVGLPQNDINAAILRLGKEAVAGNVEQIIFTYGGDSRPINPDSIRDTLFLCHESTYLKLDDDERNFQQHSVLNDVLQTAKDARAATLMLFHVSLRYSHDEIREAVAEAVRRINPGCRVLILHGDRFIDPLDTSSGRRSQRKIIDDEDEAGDPLPRLHEELEV